MKTLLAAALSATALTSVSLAGLVANNQAPKASSNAVAAPAVTAAEPKGHSLDKALAPSNQASKWTWIPAQRSNDGAPQAQIVAIPVPAPGAAALIGLSGLLVSRRRNGVTV
jgi:hypothetical protein